MQATASVTQPVELIMAKLDAAWADFRAGVEPLIRKEVDRKFMALPEEHKQTLIREALVIGRGSRISAIAVLYCDLGISQELAEKLV